MLFLAVAASGGFGHSPGVQSQFGEDIDVLRALASGDRNALAALYDRHAGSMLALGLRIIGVRREAEDLVHDVFLEAWQRAGDYDATRGSVKTWLLLRMRSRCLDRVRSHGFSRTQSLAVEPARQSSPNNVERAVEKSIDAQRVRALVAALPKAQRDVLELGYFVGLSFQEIAEALEIPIGTVKSRVSAAMVKLRAELGALHEEAS